MKRFFGLSAIGAATLLFTPLQAHAETLRNADVVALLEAGIGEEAVIALIETSDVEFDTATRTVLALSSQGVPSGVIAAMVRAERSQIELSDSSPDPLVPHFTGFYLMDNWSPEARMWKIDPTVSSQTKTGGILGYALTGGIASASLKAVLPGASAQLQTPRSRPEFYVYLDGAAGTDTGVFSNGFGSSIQSPNEFSLIALAKKRDRREARVGSLNIAGSKTGVMDQDQIPFSYEQIAQGVFRITPDADLAPGEYGFLFALAGGSGPGLSGGVSGARVFDFTVTQ